MRANCRGISVHHLTSYCRQIIINGCAESCRQITILCLSRDNFPSLSRPTGKSLDRIMQLKELAGNEDLFNAMKKLERQQKKATRKMEEESGGGKAAAVVAAPANVFDFINTKLGGKKGRVRDVGIFFFFSFFFCVI